jgi:hypothetical protein
MVPAETDGILPRIRAVLPERQTPAAQGQGMKTDGPCLTSGKTELLATDTGLVHQTALGDGKGGHSSIVSTTGD